MSDNEQELNIDLGMKSDMGPMPMLSKGPGEPYYPTARIETKDDIDFPDEGVVTFKFVKKEHTERPAKGKSEEPYYCTTLELRELVEVEPESENEAEEENEPDETSEEDMDLRGDEALDKLRKNKERKQAEAAGEEEY